jgi:hypothetical protein
MVGYLGYFYAYRAEIAAKYCINKTQVALDCRGCCHLAKTIQKLNPPEETSNGNAEPQIKNIEFEWMSLGSILKCENRFVLDYTHPEIQSLSVTEGVRAIELPPPRC